MVRLILLFSLLAIPFTDLSAQVAIEAEGLAPRLGEVRETVFESTDLPLSELDLSFGEAGGPQVLDLTAGPSGAEGFVLTTSVLSPESAPDHEMYPGSDYALLIQGSAGSLEDTYYFVEETPEGGRVVGVSGGTDCADPLADLFGGDSDSGAPAYDDYYPLTFGKHLGPLEVPMDLDLGDARMSGALALQGEVDAWGTVVVPAGRYESLRLHQWGTAHFVLEGAGPDALHFTQELDGYTWISAGVGQVASVQEVRLSFPAEIGAPPMIMTRVSRLQSYQPGPTAVALATWGRIKADRRARAGDR